MVNGFVVLQVIVGGIYNICFGILVILDVIVMGGIGLGIYIYDWDMGVFDVEDFVVIVSEVIVFIVIVIDVNNCKYFDQVVVIFYIVDVGLEIVGFCDGEVV